MRDYCDHPAEWWLRLVGVMHRLSPAAWKVVSLIACDEIMCRANEGGLMGAHKRDMRQIGIEIGEPTAEEERSSLALVDDSSHWTRLSLAQICGGVKDRTKRKVASRGTGLPKSSAIEAIEEAEQLGILRRRRNKYPGRGDLSTSYSINWKRVTELAEESKLWSNVKTTNKFGRPLRPRTPGGKLSLLDAK